MDILTAVRCYIGKSELAVRACTFVQRQARAIVIAYTGPTYDPYRNGEYFVLKQIAPQVRTAIDIGANVGDWTARLLSMQKDLETIVAVEPSRSALQVLSKRFSDDPRCIIVASAVDSSDGEIEFWEEPGPTPTSSAYQVNAGTGAVKRSVQSVSIDSLMDEYFGPDRLCDFMKIDVQGLDLRCMNGARVSLSRHRISILQFEYGPEWLHAGATLQCASDMLKSFGYRLFLIRPDRLRSLDELRLGEFFGYANLLALAPHSIVNLARLID